MNATLIIDRDDIKNELHDFLFNEWCEELNLDPDTTDRFTVTVSKAEADAVIQAAKDVIGYDAGSYSKGLEEEDEKTFLRIDANVSDTQALTLEYIHVDGFTESAYWNRSFALPLSSDWYKINTVSYTHLTLPTNREV